MAKRPLPSTEELRQLLRYNPDTGKLFWRERGPEWFRDGPRRSAQHACALWNSRYAGTEALGHIDAQGYKTGAILGRTHKAHRVIWVFEHGSTPTQIDHINGVRDDNRIANLRDVSALENARNVSRTTRNNSGVVGVKWDKRAFKWVAEIKVNGSARQIGRFDLFWDAVDSRKKAEAEFGFHPNHGR